MSVVIRKWKVFSSCLNPLPGTVTIPVLCSSYRQYIRSGFIPLCLASLRTLSLKWTRGKAYMAPSTGAIVMRSICLRLLQTNSDRRLRLSKRAFFSARNWTLVSSSTSSTGGLTSRSTPICPTELEQRKRVFSFSSWALTSGWMLYSSMQPPLSPHSPMTPLDTEFRVMSSSCSLIGPPRELSTSLAERNCFEYTFSRQTSSAITTSLYSCANCRMSTSDSLLRMEPVGFPGFISTIALTVLPFALSFLSWVSRCSRFTDQPSSQFWQYSCRWPPTNSMTPLQRGYWGTGTKMLSRLSVIMAFSTKWTPWLAPSVKNMFYIWGFGTLQVLLMNSATFRLTEGMPSEAVQDPADTISSRQAFTRLFTSLLYTCLSSSFGSSSAAMTSRQKEMGFWPNSWGLPILQQVTSLKGNFSLLSFQASALACVGTTPRTAYSVLMTWGFVFNKVHKDRLRLINIYFIVSSMSINQATLFRLQIKNQTRQGEDREKREAWKGLGRRDNKLLINEFRVVRQAGVEGGVGPALRPLDCGPGRGARAGGDSRAAGVVFEQPWLGECRRMNHE